MYDCLAESLRLLEGAPVSCRARLSRRVRHLPLAVDRDADVAATMFLRRGVSGVPLVDIHTLEMVGGRWRLLGGGGGSFDEATEARAPLADMDGPAVWQGGGGTARAARPKRNRASGARPGWTAYPGPGIETGPKSDRLGWQGDEWISYAELRVAREVSALRVADRLVPVAQHGFAVMVWTGHPPVVEALNDAGAVLGTVSLRRGGLRRPLHSTATTPQPFD